MITGIKLSPGRPFRKIPERYAVIWLTREKHYRNIQESEVFKGAY